MALLVGGQVLASERAFQWCLDTQREDGSWPMKIVGGEVEDHSGETNMSAYLAVGVWHNWLVRRDFDFVRRHWPAVRRGPRLGGRACSCPGAGSPGRRSGPTGVPARVNRGGAAGRLVEHLPLAARGRRALRADRRPAARVGAGRRPARATRCASTATCSSTSRRSRWTGTTPCSAAPSAATPAHAAARGPLGRVRRARPRHQVRRHQPVGDRRRDLRAGDGAGRARRPRPRAPAVRRHAAPARHRAAATGPATSTPTTSTGRSSTRPTPPPR